MGYHGRGVLAECDKLREFTGIFVTRAATSARKVIARERVPAADFAIKGLRL